MPDYTLTYTATMPGSKLPAEKFRIKISAPTEADAKVKLHRLVQEKVQTNFLACEENKPIDPNVAFSDIMGAFQAIDKLDEFQRKYGHLKKKP